MQASQRNGRGRHSRLKFSDEPLAKWGTSNSFRTAVVIKPVFADTLEKEKDGRLLFREADADQSFEYMGALSCT